jgi:hypothetical protein
VAKELTLGLVWELPDDLNAKALEKRLKKLMQSNKTIQIPLPSDLGLPATGATLESYTLRDDPEEGETATVIPVSGMIMAASMSRRPHMPKL